LYWLQEYRFDGLRLDAVHAILDPSETHFLTDLARAVRSTVPREIHLVLENEKNGASLLRQDATIGRRLYDAQWNDDVHHTMHTLLTGESAGYYADFADGAPDRLRRGLAEGFVYQGDRSAHHGGEERGEPSAELPPLAFVDFLQNHDQIGNRALGERLTVLTPPAAVQVCQAVLLLGPHVPLLFMGEEWGTRVPFQYFCDFEGELAEAVRTGRRREFAAFFERAEDVPDPLAEATFARSRLDWQELDEPAHAAWLEHTRGLLQVRARRIAPRLGAGETELLHSRRCGPYGLELTWRFADFCRLMLRANLGPEPAEFGDLPAGELLHATHPDSVGDMPAWSVAWVLSGDE
jgi:malto-oligosyltrehalose trehalohydrolase